jgi:hypothetical protein
MYLITRSTKITLAVFAALAAQMPDVQAALFDDWVPKCAACLLTLTS